MPETLQGAEKPMTAGMSAEAERVSEQVRRIARGDVVAAAWLYDTFAQGLFKRLGQRYAYLAHPDLEDLLQETFLVVLRDNGRLLQSFLARTEPATASALDRFLWDQACGLASNQRRRTALRKVVAIDDRPEPLLEDGEQQAIDRDLLAQLDACLEQSSSRVYLYFKLRYKDGLTPEEIAAATGWSRKATYKLRQSLEEVLQRCAEKLGIGRRS